MPKRKVGQELRYVDCPESGTIIKLIKIFKAKVGSQNHADDARRLQVCREVLGDGKDTIDSIS